MQLPDLTGFGLDLSFLSGWSFDLGSSFLNSWEINGPLVSLVSGTIGAL